MTRNKIRQIEARINAKFARHFCQVLDELQWDLNKANVLFTIAEENARDLYNEQELAAYKACDAIKASCNFHNGEASLRSRDTFLPCLNNACAFASTCRLGLVKIISHDGLTSHQRSVDSKAQREQCSNYQTAQLEAALRVADEQYNKTFELAKAQYDAQVKLAYEKSSQGLASIKAQEKQALAQVFQILVDEKLTNKEAMARIESLIAL